MASNRSLRRDLILLAVRDASDIAARSSVTGYHAEPFRSSPDKRTIFAPVGMSQTCHNSDGYGIGSGFRGMWPISMAQGNAERHHP
jgi:hypothetical protein